MSNLSRSIAIRAVMALALAGGVAAGVPDLAKADAANIIVADGGRHGNGDHGRGGRDRGSHDLDDRGRGDRGRGDHGRGDHGRDWRGHGGHHRGGHDRGSYWRGGPPPWVYQSPAPRWYPHYRSCRLEWNFWYGGYVQVCR